jgi:DNA repair exonuclease SbcCD ATPase subunit
LIDKICEKKTAQVDVNENIKALKEQLRNIENIYRKALSEKETAYKEFTEVKTILDICQKDLEYLNKKHRLETLEHSKTQINQIRMEMARLNAIGSCKVDEPTLTEIKNAEIALLQAKTILNAGIPSITLRGLNDQDLTINNQVHPISKNEEYHHTILERFSVTIPGTLQIEIVPGNSASDLLEDVQEAQKKLDDLCRELGVSSPDDAKNMYNKKRDALNQYAQQQENEKAQLRGESYETLEKDYQRLSAEVALYLNNRKTELELPKTIDIAEKKRNEAKECYEELEKFFNSAEKELDKGKKKLDHMKITYSDATISQVSLDMQIKEHEQDIDKLRNNITDEKLQLNLKNANEDLKKKKLSLETIEKNLQDRQPDKVRFQLKTVQESLKTLGEKLISVQDKKRDAESYIKINGEKGLREQLDAAKNREEHESRAYKSKVRNAEAVKLLYSILNEERDKSRRAYIKPLKDTVEQLGRLVFNPSFEVEISENLMIASRIMDNCNVPFDSLSGGAKEQLSMLSRLACAMMTSKNGMGSLIIDDALGYTDAQRLKSMGYALASASQQCQIIILTCMPERYHNIGKAKKVELKYK